ncbi:zinc ribbon domain-containing protein [Candidatus Nitrospira bockiana]
MHPQLPTLIELQTIDLRILEIKDQERRLPAQLDAAEAPLKDAQQQVQTLTAEIDALGKERRDRERDLEAHEGQVGKLRSRLTELKTNKEYQAHLFEIEMANKKKGAMEEQILVLMERIEQLQQQLHQAKGRVADAERAFAEEKGRVEAVLEGIKRERLELEHKREAVSRGLDAGLLARYAKLKGGRKDLAIAPVKNGICSGCRLQLPPQLVAEVKRSDTLQSCSYCHRILYWEGEPVTVAVASQEAAEAT